MLLSMMVFAGLVFTAARHRDLPVGRALNEWLIARPAAWLTARRLRRIVIGLVIVAVAALVWAEIAPVMASIEFSPLLWFADMTLYLDAVLMTAVAFAIVQARSVGKFLVAKLRGGGLRAVWRPRARSSSPRRAKRPPPANDDAPGFATRIAA